MEILDGMREMVAGGVLYFIWPGQDEGTSIVENTHNGECVVVNTQFLSQIWDGTGDWWQICTKNQLS
jgi:hypothetical protein